MNVQTSFITLKEQWKQARACNADTSGIEKELSRLLSSLSDGQREELHRTIDADFADIKTEISDLKNTIGIREQLADIIPAVSVSYISKNYFNRSSAWFYHRLNGNRVNGKKASFSSAEINTLRRALSDISDRINHTAKELNTTAFS